MAAPLPPVEYVPAVNPDSGAVENIHPEDIPIAQQQGWRMPTQEEWVAFQKAQFYGSPGQQAITALEGAGRGVAGPVFDLAAQGAGLTSAEAQLARREENPTTEAVGQGVGFVAPLVATAGLSGPEQVAARGALGVAAKATLPSLATRAGGAVAKQVGKVAGEGILGRAAVAGADFATQGAMLAGANVATQAALQDPKLTAESAVAEVALGAGLGGVLGFGGSAAVHGIAAALGKAGKKAVAFAASKAQSPETYKILTSTKAELKDAVFALDRAGISPDVLAPAHPETARLLLGNSERLIQLEAKYPGLTTDVLAKATPEEAALVLRDGDKIISGTLARNTINEDLAASVESAFNETTAASRAASVSRSAEIEALASKANPQAAAAQYGEAFDRLATLSAEMKAQPELFTRGAGQRLEKLAEGLARDVPEDPAEIYRRLIRARQSLDEAIPYGREVTSQSDRDTIARVKDLRRGVRAMLEDEKVWGEAGTRTAEFNQAFSRFKTAEKIASKGPKGDARQGFAGAVEQPDGTTAWVARPARINEWLNAMADGRGGAKSSNFTAYLDSASALADQMEKSGFEGAVALREQIAAIKAGFLDTEQKASVTQIVNRLKDPSAILTSKGYIPSPRQLAGEVVRGGIREVPIVGSVVGAMEGTLERVGRPSFTIGVMEAFGKSAQKMSESISSGVGRIIGGGAVKGATETAEKVVTASNYSEISKNLRAKAADPLALSDSAARQTGAWSDHAPGAAQEVTGVIARATQHLAAKLPPETNPGPFGGTYRPSPADLASFNRAAKIAQNPASILEDITDGTIHPDHVEALGTIYPALHKEMTIQIMDRLAAAGVEGPKIPFKVRMGLALFLGGNVDPMLSAVEMKANQAAITVAARNEQTGNVEPGSRSLESLNVAGRMATPMQASSSRSA